MVIATVEHALERLNQIALQNTGGGILPEETEAGNPLEIQYAKIPALTPGEAYDIANLLRKEQGAI